MLSILLLLATTLPGDVDPADLEFFEKEVRPILAHRCLSCHGPEKQKGDLRLDSRAGALAGGKTGPAVVPGKPEESILVEAINYGDLVQMPPKSKLPPKEIETLTKWIERGAPWPADKGQKPSEGAKSKVQSFDLKERANHWSFQPIRRGDPPAVKDAAWPESPIDRFLLASLEAKGLKPAPDADKRTLLRRVTFDLTGLPPTADEIDAFLKDDAPDAFAKVVDRLLASPQYGERWGRHWLDLVRYAETYGHEFDYDIPDAWRYRDYVVRAFNDDLPYDRFVTEHIAGDLLPTPRRNPKDGSNESILGTGFFLLSEGTHSPVDVRDDEVAHIDNQIDVLSKTFLGLTVACARCHDHKFDAISTKDYYALAGYLKSSRFQHASIDAPERIGEKVAELERLKAKMTASNAKPKVDDSTLAYLAAARHVLDTPTAEDANDILFEDFEGDRYEHWTAEGEAFGDGPIRLPVPDYQGDVASKGRGLVGSHNGRVAGGVGERDALTGTLTSKEFRIDRDYIHFLIGGGSHAGRTCVNLRIDGRVVATATGRNENRMRPHAFDVRAHRGKTARLQVVDDESGGWGNISLDHVVFSDEPAPPDDPGRGARAEARPSGLDGDTLARWVAALKEQPARPIARSEDGSLLFEDFNGSSYEGWTVSGHAFGSAPSRPGSVRVEPDRLTFVPAGVAHSGLVSDRLQGVLRSRTFRIERRFVNVLAWGKLGRVNVVVDGFEKIRDPIYGGLTRTIQSDAPRWHVFDLSMWQGHRAYLELCDGSSVDFSGATTKVVPGGGYLAVDEVRFSDAPLSDAPSAADLAGLEARLTRWKAGRFGEGADDGAVANTLAARRLVAVPAPAELDAYRRVEEAIPDPQLALALIDGTGEDEHVLLRGSPRTPGELVPRRFLEAIAGPDQPAPKEGSGRLDLARRVLDPSCPLTARVMVNRIWKGHFGAGIVRTPDDFGVMGEPPSHPELLDWLASEFVAKGWSIKSMHRTILLCHAYRMSSRLDPEAETIDGANRLLHRMNVRRLEAESVRDAMLALSGRLDLTMGGPSVPPYLTPLMEGRGRPGRSGPLDGDGRRSLYLNLRRNFLPPMLLAFDFPAPATTMGRRNVSNVPAQALTLLDDPLVLAQAKLWANRLLAGPGRTTPERIRDAYIAAFGRPPTDSETAEAARFLADRGETPAAWGDLCHVLFNVKEFLFIP